VGVVPFLRVVLFGVPIEVRADFVLTMAAIGLVSHGSPGSVLGWVALALIAVLAHEAGHAIALQALGDQPTITLHGGGGETRGGDHGVNRQVVVSAAGPAVGLAIGLALTALARLVPPEIAESQVLNDAILLTVGLSLLNLLPLGGLDGNVILNGLVFVATGRTAGALGWIIGVLAFLAVVIGALVLGRLDIAAFVVVIVLFNVIRITSAIGSPMVLMDLGRTEEALTLAKKTMRDDPTNREALVAYGIALLELTRWEEAKAFYDGVLERMPGDSRALAGRSVARRELGRLDEAASDVAALMALPAVGMYDVGAQFVGLFNDHQYERGLELIRSELDRPGLSRSDASHLRGLEAALEVVAGYPEEALRHADVLITSGPNMVAGHETAALALAQLGRFDESVMRAERALAQAPDHSELLEAAAIAERLSGRPDAALQLLLRAAPARPHLPRARAELSACLTQLGRHAEAAAELDSLPDQAADDPYVLYARACILSVAGRTAEATDLVGQAAGRVPALGWMARVDPLLRRPGRADA